MNPDGITPAEPLLTVVAAAQRVLHILGPGLETKAYAAALVVELRKWPVHLEHNRVFEVRYDQELVDIYVAPLVVDDAVLVDVRVASGFNPTWLAQANSALILSGLGQALLLNFQRPELDWHPLHRMDMPNQRFA